MVFQSDAAETQQFFISIGSKKPIRVPIRQFVQGIQQLNGYLDLLHCLYLTKFVKPFDDVDLTRHILQMVPSWQDQYKLTGATVPQSVCKLLEMLEHIKKAFPKDNECKRSHVCMKGGVSSKKKIVSFSDRIPKKRHVDAKQCVLCKKHGTMEC
jgi:hypothetical protein